MSTPSFARSSSGAVLTAEGLLTRSNPFQWCAGGCGPCWRPARASEASEAAVLTSREREVAQLLAEGKVNKEVAAALGISVMTVETHRAAVMRKLGINTIAELVHYAIRNHLVKL
jgi:DNA-binding NarL/FixJ family response regulator